MLLQPKATPKDVGTVSKGLGGDPPPTVQSCITPPYGRGGPDEENLVNATISFDIWPTLAGSQPDGGTVEAAGEAETTAGVGVGICRVRLRGPGFPVPPGPTSYTTTISYDWHCSGWGFAFFGIVIVNVDLAILIDKRDGTQETHAREISLLTVPVLGGDGFSHDAQDVSVTIPFTRHGTNGTVRIMVGADGQATVVSLAGCAHFWAQATVRQIRASLPSANALGTPPRSATDCCDEGEPTEKTKN